MLCSRLQQHLKYFSYLCLEEGRAYSVCAKYKGWSLQTIRHAVHKIALFTSSCATGSGGGLRQWKMHIYQPIYVYALPWALFLLFLMRVHKLENIVAGDELWKNKRECKSSVCNLGGWMSCVLCLTRHRMVEIASSDQLWTLLSNTTQGSSVLCIHSHFCNTPQSIDKKSIPAVKH